MKNKIKKLTIVAEKGGFILHKAGDMTKQKITIKNNGQVWWTGLRYPTEQEIEKGVLPENEVKMTEYKKLNEQTAVTILAQAQEILPAKIDSEFKQFVCDACPDEIYIQYEDGKILCGQAVGDFLTMSVDLPDFYKKVAEVVSIDNLLFCEDYYECF